MRSHFIENTVQWYRNNENRLGQRENQFIYIPFQLFNQTNRSRWQKKDCLIKGTPKPMTNNNEVCRSVNDEREKNLTAVATYGGKKVATKVSFLSIIMDFKSHKQNAYSHGMSVSILPNEWNIYVIPNG